MGLIEQTKEEIKTLKKAEYQYGVLVINHQGKIREHYKDPVESNGAVKPANKNYLTNSEAFQGPNPIFSHQILTEQDPIYREFEYLLKKQKENVEQIYNQLKEKEDKKARFWEEKVEESLEDVENVLERGKNIISQEPGQKFTTYDQNLIDLRNFKYFYRKA